MQARYLAYQHDCKRPRAEGELRQIGLRRLAALQERAVQRLAPDKRPTSAHCAMDTEEEHYAMPTSPANVVANTLGDPRLWDYVTPCGPKQASKAVDVRSAFVARFGKADATLLLNG